KLGAFFQAFGLQMLPYLLEIGYLEHHVVLYLVDSVLQNIRGGYEHICGVNIELPVFFDQLIFKGIECLYLFDLIAKKMDPKGMVGITGKDIYDIALYPKVSVLKFRSGPGIQALHQLV